jgi:hypothetical protein
MPYRARVFVWALTAETHVKAASVIGKCMPRHRAQEFRKSLDEVEHNVPTGLVVHVIMDNASSHGTRLIRNWFARRPYWHQHFTPTSSSRFFALLAEKPIKRGVHNSVKELITAIEAFINQHHQPNATALDQVGPRHSGVYRALLPPHPGHPCPNCIGTSESAH